MSWRSDFKDTHRKKSPSNETAALTKSMNMDIWVNGTLKQVFVRGSLTETRFSKKQSSLAKLRSL